MIEKLKPYPEYEESGLPWIGKIPEHWKKRRTKFLFWERVQKGFPDEPLLAATQSRGVIRKDEYGSRTVTAMKDLHLLKLVEHGDYVISLRSFEGGIEIAHSRGIISPAYTVLAPKKEVNQGYYTHFFKSPDFIKSLTLFVTGIREGQNIDYERLSRAYLPLPPPDEQAAIVRFLNWSNGQLEKSIRAKRRIITLLNEQKQVIIHRAVTRGLDPSIPLKPSGISWLGDIPEHWEIRRLRQLVKINPSKSESNALYQNEDVTFLPMEKVGSDGSIDSSLIVKAITLWNGFTYFQRGDVIVAKITPCFENGKGSFLEMLPTLAGFGSTEFHVLRPGKFLLGAYLRMITSSKEFLANGINSMTGSAGQQRVPSNFIKNYPIALPTIDEQFIILDTVGSKISEIDNAISFNEREIELLCEYRTRLIADVVTGKLDVREAAANLPDEAVIDMPESDNVEALEDEPFEEGALV